MIQRGVDPRTGGSDGKHTRKTPTSRPDQDNPKGSHEGVANLLVRRTNEEGGTVDQFANPVFELDCIRLEQHRPGRLAFQLAGRIVASHHRRGQSTSAARDRPGTLGTTAGARQWQL